MTGKIQGLISVTQASQRLGISPHTVRKHVANSALPFVRLYGRVLFDPDRLDQFVREHSIEPSTGGEQ